MALNQETHEQRLAKASYGPADVARVAEFGSNITVAGIHVQPNGARVVSLPEETRRFFNGANRWLERQMVWTLGDGTPIPAGKVRAALEATQTQAQARITGIATELTNGRLTTQAMYEGMQEATKLGHASAAALARGGVDKMTPEAWRRVSEIVLQEWEGKPGKWPGLRAAAQDIERGRYGRDPLNGLASRRLASYGDQFRTTYENTRADVAIEQGEEEFIVLLGAADHCPGCLARSARGYIPMQEWEGNKIGDKQCGSLCHCVVQFKLRREELLESEQEAIDRAQRLQDAYLAEMAKGDV